MVHKLLATGPNSASLDMRDAGKITGVSISGVGGAAGSAQVSFNSTASPATHDDSGTLAQLQLTTAAGSTNSAMFVMNEPVDVGERIFLHVAGAGNSAVACIYTDAVGPRPSPRRR